MSRETAPRSDTVPPDTHAQSIDTGPSEPWREASGACTCRAVTYRLTSAPLIVHCCHCRWCQRESGAAFALNLLIESQCVELLGRAPEGVLLPTASGKGQRVLRCPSCQVAVWSHYAGAGERVLFVRAGTLDEPDRFPPDIHIYIASKQPWVMLPPGAAAFAEYYQRSKLWPPSSIARWKALFERGRAPAG